MKIVPGTKYGYEIRHTEKCGWGYVVFHASGLLSGVHAENCGTVAKALLAAQAKCRELEAYYQSLEVKRHVTED